MQSFDQIKHARNRAIALAEALADALNSLGEPFPIVRKCIAAGDSPEMLIETMRDCLADIVPEEMMEGYQECALWSSVDDDGQPLDDSGMLLAQETLDWFLADCAAFIGAWQEMHVFGQDWQWGGLSWSQIGHDLWLTRNGHGTGFWDRGLGELGEELSDVAERQGSRELYVGDDGMIYC